jgi:hypothetical protein
MWSSALSSSPAIVISEYSTEPFATLDLPGNGADLIVRLNDRIGQPLMIPLCVIMLEVRRGSTTQRLLAEEDHSGKRFGFETSHESFDVRIQIGTSRWQQQRFGAFILQNLSERKAELPVAIHDQVTLSIEKSVFRIGKIPGNLLHPGFVGMGRAARKMDPACFQFHDEQQVECDEATLRPNFNGREVDSGQHVPMGFEKRGPLSLMLSLRSRFDTVRCEDIFHGGIGDVIADIGQGALDAIVTPGRVVLREPQDQVHDDLANAWPPWFLLPTIAVIPFLGYELSMPAEDCVGSDDGRQFPQCFAAQGFAFNGQHTSLVVGQQDALLPQDLHEGNDLGVLKLDDLLLPVMNPAGQDGKQQLPGLQNVVHGISGC